MDCQKEVHMVIYYGEKLKQSLSGRLPGSFRERYAMEDLHRYIRSGQSGCVLPIWPPQSGENHYDAPGNTGFG